MQLVFATAWGLVSSAMAEQPPAAVAAPPAESRKAPPPRVKPQVIYHLPPASAYAAALHSQAKTQRDVLPIDSSMPTSLQMARGAANDAAAKAQQEPGASPSNAKESAKPAPAPPQRERPRLRSQRPVLRSHPASKAHGAGNSHGNKSHRK